MRFALPVILGQLLLVVGQFSSDSSEASCSADAPCAATGAQLIQMRQFESRSKVALPSENTVNCNLEMGKTLPLTDDGFVDVSESCCYNDMKDFIRRVAKSMDLDVCDEGGLSGFAPFFSCTNASTYDQLKGEMGASLSDKCKWLAPSSANCSDSGLPPSCGVSTKTPGRQSLIKGYVGIEAEKNPPALVTNEAVGERMKQVLANSFGLPEEAVNVVVGTGEVNDNTYQLSLKSRISGKWVEEWPDGSLVASSSQRKTFDVIYNPSEKAFSMTGVVERDLRLIVNDQYGREMLMEWKRDEEEGYYYFQDKTSGRYLVEDADGHSTLSKSTGGRLEADFHGSGVLGAGGDTPVLPAVNLKGQFPRKSSELLGGLLSQLRSSCTVLVTYEVVQTEPPSLNEVEVTEKVKKADPAELEKEVAKDIGEVDDCVGKLQLSLFKYCAENGMCDDKSTKLAHTDRNYNHVSHPISHPRNEQVTDYHSTHEKIISPEDGNISEDKSLSAKMAAFSAGEMKKF